MTVRTAVDALGHVDIISRRPSGSILTFLGLDGDGLGGTDGLAQFARNATLFSSGIPITDQHQCSLQYLVHRNNRLPSQSMLASEPRGNGTLFKGIVNSVRRAEVLLQYDVHAAHHLGEQEVAAQTVTERLGLLVPALGRLQTIVFRRWAGGGSGTGCRRREEGGCEW